jgi:hypothetical protein
VRTSTADEKFAAMLEHSYGRRGWQDWRRYCAVTAPTAEAAARHILAAGPDGGSSAGDGGNSATRWRTR